MRISKMVFNFVVLVAVASIAGTSNASDCNMRSGVPRTSNTNPERTTASKSVEKTTKAQKSTKRSGRK